MQHAYFSSFDQSNSKFVAFLLPFLSYMLRLAVAATAPTDSSTTFAITTATTTSITVRQSSLVFISQLFLLNLKCVDSF